MAESPGQDSRLSASLEDPVTDPGIPCVFPPGAPDPRAVLRTHLTHPLSPRALHDELCRRAGQQLAGLLGQHQVGPDGGCLSCGPGTGCGAAACGTLLEIARDLGLHLRLFPLAG